MKRLGGLLAGALDGAAIAMIYATIAELPTENLAKIGAVIESIIGLIFPSLAFIVCIPIAIYFFKHWQDHDPRKNPKNRINC